MKLLFWIVFAIAVILLILGFALFPAPQSTIVDVADLEAWYLQQAFTAAIVGALVALPGALLAERLVQPRPREAASTFNSRVVSYGLYVIGAAVAMVMIISSILAGNQTSWQMSGADRVLLVLGAGSFLAIPAAATVGAAVVFAVGIRMRSWGGRYAVL